MFKAMAEKLLARRLQRSPTISESIDEAASQHLGKESQVQMATDAIFMAQIRDIADDEMETARHYKRQNGMLPKSTGKPMAGDRNIILCDDYHTGSSRALAAVFTVLVAALIVGGTMLWSQLQKPQRVEYGEDTVNQYDIERWVPTDDEISKIGTEATP